MPKTTENRVELAMLRSRIADLERENAELRAAKRLAESMAVIDGARLRRIERHLREALGPEAAAKLLGIA